jgi:putative ATP-dependent endonuclease of the OLD family
MVTTHSPVFIDLSRDNTSIIRVERNPSGIKGVTLFRPEQAALGADDKENLKLLNLFDPYVAEFFFGGKVVVVEGDTEYSAFKLVAALIPQEFADLHIIRARGKATIASLAKVLNHFGAGYSILHDSDLPTVEIKAKGGGVKTMANPAWATNNKILAVVKAAPAGAKVRLVASLPNFEMAYFDYQATGEKPYTAVKNLRENSDKRNIIAKLLKALTNFDSELPDAAMEWDDIEKLSAAIE